MINNVSHELRTPLTHIMGYSELLADGMMGPLNNDQMYAVQVLSDRAQALNQLVNMLLDMRALSPELLEWSDIDLKHLASYTATVWQERAQRRSLTIDLQVGDVPLVRGDHYKLQEALDQLIENAFKFTPDKGTVTVGVQAQGDEVWLTVSDSGIGIPPDKLEKIFDRFYQIDGSSTRRFGGMGIGLSLVHLIVSLHKGRVWATSAGVPGQGATFYIALPALHKSGD